ncbi:SLC13 family permease [Flavobacteriaceae bacterium]|jgi:solute carrier family 13 (sodium-dependent dicarboxylate transporter), member 2/3/5|nr:SLC13 family permease [Flavobacteriaceae bacterium]MDA9139673.1 SLC13 family permease [Flavobacteriaceae bacterium]
MKASKNFGLILGPLMFFVILLFFHPSGLNDQSNAVLAATIWIAIWWIFEALPIAVTALLPIVLFPIAGGMDLAQTTASYGHKLIFLIMGGFMIAIAIEKWNLHKRIALNIIYFIGTDLRKIILGFMVATAFLSMWISNTATAVMMLPIGVVIIKQLKDNPNTDENENNIFGKALMLAIAYSASIGGIATLIGTPPNLVMAGIVSQVYGYEISFLEWIVFGLPVSMLLLAICWVYLTRYAFTFKQDKFPDGREEILRLKNELGVISYEQKIVGLVFISVGFCWITRSFLLQKIFPALDDAIIAIIFAMILFIINAKSKKDKILEWKEAVKMPWGILLLFGGGMSLAKAFDVSGLAIWIGNQITAFGNFDLFLFLILLVTAINFLTEVTSNVATTAMLLPVIAPIALELDIHPFILMTAAAVAASCAFMLPVATPPNAIVFGSGYLRIPDMVKKGFLLNIISILIIVLMVYYLLPVVWDIDKDVFPKEFLD